jgi:hypothetical protein
MPWFKVDDGFHGHPKVVDLSLAAVGIWSLAGSWCAKYLTDGVIALRAIERMGGNEDLARELVAHGLWLQVPEGFMFKDWSEYQPLKVAVEAERAAARDRMATVRAQKKGVRANTSRTTDERSGEQSENFGARSPEVRIAPSQSQSLPEGGVSTVAEMPPSRYCSRHPHGSEESCRACGDARRSFDAHLLAIKNRPTYRAPTASERASRMCVEPGHEEYPLELSGPLKGKCFACERVFDAEVIADEIHKF